MAARKTKDDDAPAVFTYKFRGRAPVIPMELTQHGVVELVHNDVVELPVPVVIHDLVPQDDATEEATGALVAEMYPELAPDDDVDDVEETASSDDDATASTVESSIENAGDAGTDKE